MGSEMCIRDRFIIHMIELLFWSLIVVTWITVGMHVIKEFIRFYRKRDD